MAMDNILKRLLFLFKNIVDHYDEYKTNIFKKGIEPEVETKDCNSDRRLTKIFEEMDPQLVVENESGKSMHLIDFFLANFDQNRKQIIDFFIAQLNADKLLYDNLDLLHKNAAIQDNEEMNKIEFLLKKRVAINFLNYDAKNILKENKDSCDSVTIDDKLVKCYSEIFQEFKNLSKILISQFINVDGKTSQKHRISINNEKDIALLRFCLFLKV